jgi:hypothetical protein
MKIACLGFGSLLWKPGALTLASDWRPGGPALPLEFARVGDGGELAVTICDDVPPMPTWWACLQTDRLAVALESLRQREEIDPAHPEWLGSCLAGGAATATPSPDERTTARVARWMQGQALDAVIWTALPPRPADKQEGRMPSAAEAVAYLDGLAGDVRDHAEQYVRRVPVPLATAYRAAIEKALGWTPLDTGSEAFR